VSVDLSDWAPTSLELSRPRAARVWDYFLGGSHNFAVDRQVTEAAIAMKPNMPELARQVRWCAALMTNMAPAAYTTGSCCHGQMDVHADTACSPAVDHGGRPGNQAITVSLEISQETQLAFKMVKWIRAVEFATDCAQIGMGQGGWREDHRLYANGAGI
jgi:hypothetical protein